jgi:hypothetical protein
MSSMLVMKYKMVKTVPNTLHRKKRGITPIKYLKYRGEKLINKNPLIKHIKQLINE